MLLKSKIHFRNPMSWSSAQHIRKKRRVKQSRYVEVMAVADHTLVRAIGSEAEAEKYIMVLMNIVGILKSILIVLCFFYYTTKKTS